MVIAHKIPEKCDVCGQRFCICPKKLTELVLAVLL